MESSYIANITPRILAAALDTLRESCAMPWVVTRKYQMDAGQIGTSIDIPVGSAISAGTVSPGTTPAANATLTPTYISIPVDQWQYAKFAITDKEAKEFDANGLVIPLQAQQAMKTLANGIDKYLLGLYKSIPYYVGETSGGAFVTPFATTSTSAILIDRLLSENLAPMYERYAVIGPAVKANMLKIEALTNASWAGVDYTSPIMTSMLPDYFGMGWMVDQNVSSNKHTAGTAAAATVTVASEYDHDDDGTTIVLKVSTSTATVKTGDIIVITDDALDNGQAMFVAMADATLDDTGVNVTLDRAVGIAGSTVDATSAVTVIPSHTVNLAFQREAIAFVTRPLEGSISGLGSIVSAMTDPITGITVRLEVSRENSQVAYKFDVLYGGKVIRPEFAVRLCGAA